MQELANPGDSATGDTEPVEGVAIAVIDAEQLTYSSPSVRKLARELGIDLTTVRGTGLRGRITRDDIQAWVRPAAQRQRAGLASTRGD